MPTGVSDVLMPTSPSVVGSCETGRAAARFEILAGVRGDVSSSESDWGATGLLRLEARLAVAGVGGWVEKAKAWSSWSLSFRVWLYFGGGLARCLAALGASVGGTGCSPSSSASVREVRGERRSGGGVSATVRWASEVPSERRAASRVGFEGAIRRSNNNRQFLDFASWPWIRHTHDQAARVAFTGANDSEMKYHLVIRSSSQFSASTGPAH